MQSFSREWLYCWQRIPNKGTFIGILTAWLLLFQFLGNSTFGYVDTPSLFQWLYNAYNVPDSEDAQGNLIPFAVLVILWMKRDKFLALPSSTWLGGLPFLALALGLHFVGYTVQQPRISIVALFLGTYAAVGLTWGRLWMKEAFFPFFLFVFSIPLGTLIEKFTLPLRVLATNITFIIAHGIFGLSVVKQGTQLFDANGGYNFDVAAACSGIRSLIALLALTTIYGMLTFRTFWKRTVVIIWAIPLAVACNVLRLVTVVVAAEAFGQKVGNFVHEWFGFVTYGFALAGVLALGYFLRDKHAPAFFAQLEPT